MNLFPQSNEWPVGQVITYNHIASPDAICGPVLVVGIHHSTDRLIVSADRFSGRCFSLLRSVTNFQAIPTTLPEAQP